MFTLRYTICFLLMDGVQLIKWCAGSADTFFIHFGLFPFSFSSFFPIFNSLIYHISHHKCSFIISHACKIIIIIIGKFYTLPGDQEVALTC